MSFLKELLDANTDYVKNFHDANLTVVPRLPLVVLTCVDPRVDPAHFLGLKLGDAKVLRNVGGRVTDAVIQNLAFAAGLLKQVEGDWVPLELAIVQHTECGAARLSDSGFCEAIHEDTGIDHETLSELAISGNRETIMGDIARLEASPLCPPGIQVSGHLYDVRTGQTTELIAVKPIQVVFPR